MQLISKGLKVTYFVLFSVFITTIGKINGKPSETELKDKEDDVELKALTKSRIHRYKLSPSKDSTGGKAVSTGLVFPNLGAFTDYAAQTENNQTKNNYSGKSGVGSKVTGDDPLSSDERRKRSLSVKNNAMAEGKEDLPLSFTNEMYVQDCDEEQHSITSTTPTDSCSSSEKTKMKPQNETSETLFHRQSTPCQDSVRQQDEPEIRRDSNPVTARVIHVSQKRASNVTFHRQSTTTLGLSGLLTETEIRNDDNPGTPRVIHVKPCNVSEDHEDDK